MRIIVKTLLIIVAVFIFGYILGPTPPETIIIDGDTIKIGTKSYRLIGIDAPESNRVRYGHSECYGKEAKEYLQSLLSGQKIWIEPDSSQSTMDKYGRGLAYIFTVSGNINQQMIVSGFAKEYTYGKAYKYQSKFKELESNAKQNRIGMWGCGF